MSLVRRRLRNPLAAAGGAVIAFFLLVAVFPSLFAPAPPSVTAVAWSAQAVWLLVAWGYWIDRHRHVRAGV